MLFLPCPQQELPYFGGAFVAVRNNISTIPEVQAKVLDIQVACALTIRRVASTA